MSYKYCWKTAQGRGVAHLVIGDLIRLDGHAEAAVCGVHVDTDSPYAARCKTCLRGIANLAVDIAAPPPTRVKEKLCLTVVRNAGSESIQDFVLRKLKTAKSIEPVEIELIDLGPAKEE